MHPADGKHAGDPPAGAHDHLAADVLAEDAVRRADIVAPFRGHRGGLEPETVVCDRARCLVHDAVRRRSAVPEGEIEARQRQLEADDVGLQDAEGCLEKLLARLIPLENHDRARIHGAALYTACPCGSPLQIH